MKRRPTRPLLLARPVGYRLLADISMSRGVPIPLAASTTARARAKRRTPPLSIQTAPVARPRA